MFVFSVMQMRKNITYTLLVAIIYCFLPGECLAQYENNFWYFGNLAGVDFSSGQPLALLDGKMQSKEGCAVISDKNGNLLFYTNGLNIWNRNHQLMKNGSGLKGDDGASNSSMILPDPGNTEQYYLFAVDDDNGIFGLTYSVINMALDNNMGAVLPNKKNISILNRVTEKITAVKNADGNSIWIISHEYGSNRFFSFLLNKYGINKTPVISSTGTAHAPEESGDPGIALGCMKASRKGNKLALAVQYLHFFEIFDFNKRTGKVSNPLKLPDYLYAYGVEFSPNEKYFYGTRRYATMIYQFNLRAANVLESVKEIGPTLGANGALQMGPFGNIYLSCREKKYLGVISQPNRPGKKCNFEKEGVYLNGRTAIEGLPNFIQLFHPDPTFTRTGHCLGDTIWFKMNNKVFIDSVKWDLGVRAKSSSPFTAAKDTFYTYKDSGNYSVKLTIYSMKGSSDDFQEVLRVDLLPEINLGKDISACELSPPLLDGGTEDGRKWLWNNGSTERFFTPSKSGIYSLLVEKNQCFSFDSVRVKINPMPKIAIVDLKHSDCNKNNGRISVEVEGEVEKHKFIWEGFNINNNIPVMDSLAPGDYPLTVINEYGCSGIIDTLEIREFGVPEIELFIDKNIACPGEEVSLKVTKADYYEWSTGETDSEIIITEQESKAFWVKGISAGGCYKKKDFFINIHDKPPISFDNSISACEGDTVVLDGGGGDYQFKWENGSNNRFLPVNFNGKYTVNITDNFGCNYLRSAEIHFNKNPIPDLGPDISLLCNGNETILDGGEWQSYSWSTGEKTSLINVNKPGLYNLTVSDENNCKGRDQVYINIPPKLNLSSRIVQPDCINCNNGTITINPEGGSPPYFYLWSNFETNYARANLSPGLYSVQVTDVNNCSELLKTELSSDTEIYIEVPNAFTPNGDGINDEWRIKNTYLHPGIKVRVFDNRGVEIFSSTGYASPWNGRYMGSPLPTDTYYYVIDTGNGKNPITGQVTLII